MRRKINLTNKEFERWLNTPLYTDDENSYEIVCDFGAKGKGCCFKITATRSDGISVTDISDVSNDGVISYILAGNMYGVEGELTIRVQILNDTTLLTEKIIHAEVKKGIEGTEKPSTKSPILDTLLKKVTKLETGKVDKKEGKELSTNDFTNEAKEKLAELENYDDTTITEDIAQLQTELNKKVSKEDIVNVYQFYGSVNTYNDLPTEYESIPNGAVYNVLDTEMNYAWNGTDWDVLGGEHKDVEARTEINFLENYGTTDVYVLQEGIDFITDETGTVITGTVDGKLLDKSGYTVVIPEGITKITSEEFTCYLKADKLVLPESCILIENESVNVETQLILSEGMQTFEGLAIGFEGDLYLPSSINRVIFEHFSGNIYANEKATIFSLDGNVIVGNIFCPNNINDVSINVNTGELNIYIYNPNATIDIYYNDHAMTVHGYAGSTAEAFAKENGYTFVNMGSDYSAELGDIESAVDHILELDNSLLGGGAL